MAKSMKHKISSINPCDADGPTGIITERDLLRQLRRTGDAAFDMAVNEVAVFPLESLSASAPMMPFCSAMISTLRNLPDKCQRYGATSCWWQRAW
jgi:CBS domain-containing protein